MNKVIIINLNGNAYQLEENGYDALRAYLDTAAGRLEGNPDRDEIVADIEQSIADKFRALLGANKSVVVTKEVESVIAEMGNVEDSTGETAAAPGAAKAGPAPTPATGEPAGAAKRLYKINDGAMLCGVCNGIAAYMGIDVTIVRIVFVLLSLAYGSGGLLYFIMAFVIPSAHTPAEKAAAMGTPSTSQEFIRRAREGYYGGMKTFKDKKAYKEWKGKFKQEMRGWGRDFSREFHQNKDQWAQNWRTHWNQHPNPGSSVAYPFLKLFCVVIALVCVCSVISLLTTGSVMGIGLPAGVPMWVGVVFLIVFFQLIAWPIKAARHSIYYGGGYGPGYGGPFLHLFHTVTWLGLIVVIVWFANRHSFHFHEALKSLPHEVHQAVDSVKDWWDKQ
jgi:phage shock protein PspC (stress-responsive transcriptional regulator)